MTFMMFIVMCIIPQMHLDLLNLWTVLFLHSYTTSIQAFWFMNEVTTIGQTVHHCGCQCTASSPGVTWLCTYRLTWRVIDC